MTLLGICHKTATSRTKTNQDGKIVGHAEIYYDLEEESIVFAAEDLAKIFRNRGTKVTMKSLTGLEGIPEGVYVVIAKNSPDLQALLAAAGGNAPGTLAEQDYSLRVTGTGKNKGYWAIGGDRIGAMYGGIHIGEIVAGGSPSNMKDEDHSPYIRKRGLKFNIPLDKRTPSFDDGGTSAASNRENVWDINFWKEYLDVLARQRYNVLSLWNRHPFPSLVKVPGYEDVALKGVLDRNNNFINDWTIEQKIEFWNEVLELAHNRGIECWFVTWNIHNFGTEHTDYGWSQEYEDEPYKDETYKDYLKKSVISYFRTYPLIAGIGTTAGENMKDKNRENLSAGIMEQWLWDTYGEAIMQIKKEDPDRKIRFVHRHWLTDWDEIGSRFGQLPDGFEMALKYAQARLYSSTNPSWPLRQLRKIPKDMATWWNLRNDDIFIQRWGDPDYVRQYILNFPHESKPCEQSPCLTAGYVMGSDRYLWARESLSKHPQTPRQLEVEKHWYKFLLWGRMGYDPDTSDELLTGLIQYRFPDVDGSRVFNSWKAASKIIPMVNRFHWWPWDYMWYVEKGTGDDHWSKNEDLYHSIDKIISNETQNVSGYINIKEFVNGNISGTSPLEVANELEAYATEALEGLKGISVDDNTELKETLGDIRSQAYFGLYWANKIRGGVELERYRMNKNTEHKKNAVEYLEKALEECKKYTAQLDESYEEVRFSSHGIFDYEELISEVEKDIDIARNAE